MFRASTLRFTAIATLAAACSGGSERGTTDPVIIPSMETGAVVSSASVTRTVGIWQVTMTDLGVLPGGSFSSAYDINNIGEVVGIASDAGGINRRVIWQNGVIVDTLPQPSSAVTTATQLNERRQFVGVARQNSSLGYGVFWTQGTALKLQPLPGTAASGAAANGINAIGDVAGGGTGGGGTTSLYQHAGIWRNGLLLRDLGVIPGGDYSMAYDINDAGQVTGTGTAAGTFARQYAFVWTNGVFTVLPDLPGSFLQSVGQSINTRGDVAGQSNGGEPVVWKNGAVQALPMPTRLANTISEINDSGDVVGTVGTIGALWKSGQYVPLDPWPGASVTSSRARGINNQGVVVGESYMPGGGVHAVQWAVTRVTAGNTAPKATLAATTATSIRRGQSVTVRAVITDPDAADGPWAWTFFWGNGPTSGSLTAPGTLTATRSYTKVGTFSVRIQVTDAHGATGTSNIITIRVR
jgi:probable HAF family extracellular repeat protein